MAFKKTVGDVPLVPITPDAYAILSEVSVITSRVRCINYLPREFYQRMKFQCLSVFSKRLVNSPASVKCAQEAPRQPAASTVAAAASVGKSQPEPPASSSSAPPSAAAARKESSAWRELVNGRPPLSKSSALVLSPTADCPCATAPLPPASAPTSAATSAPTSMSTSAPASVLTGNGQAHDGGASSAQASAAQTQTQTARGFEAERGAPPIYKNMPRFASSEMLRGWRSPGPRGPFNAPFANMNGFRFNARGSGFGPGPFPYASGPNRPPFQRISPMPKSSESLASTSGPPPPPPPPPPNWRCAGSPLQSARNQHHSNAAAANRAEQPATTTTVIRTTSASSSSSSNSTSVWISANPYSSSYAAITAKRNAAGGVGGGMCRLPARTVAIARTQSVTVAAACPALPPPPGLLPPRLGSFSEKHSSSDSGSASGSGSGAPEPPAQNAPKSASASTGGVGQPIGAPSGKEVQVAPLEVDVGIGSEQRGRQSQRPSESDSGLAGSAPSTQRESAPDSPLARTECCSELDTRAPTGPPTRTQSLADADASDAAEAADTAEADTDTSYKAHESASSERKPALARKDANAACEPKRPSNSTASARKKSSSAPPSASASASASASVSGSGCGNEATGAAAAPPPKSKSARRRAAHKLRAADRRDPKTQSNDSAEYCSAHSSSPSPTHSASAGHKNTDRSSIANK